MPKVPLTKSLTLISDSSYSVNTIFEGVVVLVTEYDSVFMVITKYGNYFFGYSGLSKSIVKKGDKLKAGKTIGNMGKDLDGKYSLDFTLYKGEEELDPYLWLASCVH